MRLALFMNLPIGYIVFAAAIIGVVVLVIQHLSKKYLHNNRDNWARLLLIVPESLINPFAAHRPHEIALSSELYKRLGELNIPFTLEAVVHTLGEEIYFYIIVRNRDKRRVHSLVESLWPTAYLNDAQEYDLWLDDKAEKGNVVGGYLTLVRPYSIPLKTADRGHFEPFLGLLRGLSTLAAVGEGAAVQVIVRPADSHALASVGEYLQKLENGTYHPSKHMHEEFIITPETIKRVREKVGSPLLRVNFRIITSTTTGDAEKIFKHLTKHIEESSHDRAQQHNVFAAKIPKDQLSLTRDFLEYSFNDAQEMIMSTDELATYFHLPGPTTAAPKIKR